ncbi:helix-turn-helix domain-containing protein [Frigoribacterium sp. CG_9.8]|uniref:helix-turn-helix domain-containing protein n=1 Tax=Frigoribacterium sp. CG_9.8 TaxID=2787733 RepID=UPI0018CAD01D|nr:helix-turn-helix transcriptional regulator [Frigoribacterium sp. CG_9.8]MBG6106586.1 transcriptional regulator with XRE-family HTH domain [Frigoribacterium sp. CG_9.8]
MAHITNAQIGDNIRMMRKRRNLTQAEFVTELNVIGTPGKWDQSRVSAIETGRILIYADMVGYLAEALDTTTGALLAPVAAHT